MEHQSTKPHIWYSENNMFKKLETEHNIRNLSHTDYQINKLNTSQSYL